MGMLGMLGGGRPGSLQRQAGRGWSWSRPCNGQPGGVPKVTRRTEGELKENEKEVGSRVQGLGFGELGEMNKVNVKCVLAVVKQRSGEFVGAVKVTALEL